jgi:hypothetical protein
MLRGLIVGLLLVSVSAVMHTTGIFLIAEYFIHIQKTLEREFSVIRYSNVLSAAFGLITLLHLAEMMVWAVFYRLSGLLSNSESAVYFSMGSYTTIGPSNLLLPEKWRLLGGLESVGGMLLFGLSTAFLFTIIRQLFESRLRAKFRPYP